MINTIRAANTSIRRSIYRGSEVGGSNKPDQRRQTIRMLGNSVTRAKSSLNIIVIMSASVVLLFFISWTPFHLQRLGYVYFKSAEFFRTVNQYLFYFSGDLYICIDWDDGMLLFAGILYYMSSTLNPLLYTVLSLKYR